MQQFPVAIPRSRKIIMTFRERTYHIFISVPLSDPPPSGFPVIYLLDGNSVFGTVTEAVRAQSRFPERTGVYPAVVVGIGYDTEMPFHISRHYDFTYPSRPEELPPHPTGGEWPEQGGSEAFIQFIEEELKPAIAVDYPVDTSNQTLFGHSLGGLFVLHVLFAHPHLFQHYIAGSPSIVWNERQLLAQEQAFASSLMQEPPTSVPVRLFMAIGDQERESAEASYRLTEAMAARLAALSLSRPSFEFSFKTFTDETHISILPALVSQGIRFAMKKTSPAEER